MEGGLSTQEREAAGHFISPQCGSHNEASGGAHLALRHGRNALTAIRTSRTYHLRGVLTDRPDASHRKLGQNDSDVVRKCARTRPPGARSANERKRIGRTFQDAAIPVVGQWPLRRYRSNEWCAFTLPHGASRPGGAL